MERQRNVLASKLTPWAERTNMDLKGPYESLCSPECGQISVAWALFDSGFAGKTLHESLVEC